MVDISLTPVSIDYETNEIKNWTVPTPLAGPLGLILASDGGLWFCEFLAVCSLPREPQNPPRADNRQNKIGRLNVTDGTFKEYPLPLTLTTPAVMRAETEGRYLWFTAIASNAIGRIDMVTGETKTYTDPRLLASPIEDTVDGDGNIWYSTLTRNTLNYLTPSTGNLTTIDQPAPALSIVNNLTELLPSLPPVANIAIHYEPSDNSMWFTELVTNRVGRYQL